MELPGPTGEDAAAQQNEGVAEALWGIKGPNATRWATHSGMPAKNRQEPAVNRLRFTDAVSVFADCAVRHIGACEHDGLVPAVALACWWAGRRSSPERKAPPKAKVSVFAGQVAQCSR